MPYPVSDHCNGEAFFNPDGEAPKGLLDVLKWSFTRRATPWPVIIPTSMQPAPPNVVLEGPPRVTVVGHSTVLIQTGGLNILTDPIWSVRASPLSFIGPQRRREPRLRYRDLPDIDVILLSHNHYDHLDRPTLRYLARHHHRARVITTLGVSKHVPQGAKELDWWEGEQLNSEVSITCVPAKHFSARTPFDRNRSLWCGFMLQSPGGPIYFAGDTAWGNHFGEIRERLGTPEIALLPIGAYQPRWFMSGVHMDPQEAVQAHRIIGAKKSIAIHYGTFALADEGPEDPAIALRDALKSNPQDMPFVL